MRYILLFWLFATTFCLHAQTDLYRVELPNITSELRETKMQNPIAFFEVEGDTILSYDFENMKKPTVVRVKLPRAHQTYAYGFTYFNGVANMHSPGMMNLLLCDYKSNKPIMYVDRNNNSDFTDDGPGVEVPRAYNLKDTVDFTLSRVDNPNAFIGIRLSRIGFHNKVSYRDMLNEYYRTFYPNRKFIGIEYCLREQRQQLRWGMVYSPADTFKIALLDANSNGLYNEPGIDKVITANTIDSFFDASNELQAYTIAEKKDDLFFDKNGITYHILSIDAAGMHMNIRIASDLKITGIEPGKKAPNIRFYDHNGKQFRLKKFKKKQVYIYLTSPGSKNFEQDTIELRQLMNKHGHMLQVVGFIDVVKSYELRIFGTYSNLNWIAAFKDKYIIRDLQLKGIPCSIWLERKRKVKQYNITPQQLLNELDKKE
jgi:hypothetical protein